MEVRPRRKHAFERFGMAVGDISIELLDFGWSNHLLDHRIRHSLCGGRDFLTVFVFGLLDVIYG